MEINYDDALAEDTLFLVDLCPKRAFEPGDKNQNLADKWLEHLCTYQVEDLADRRIRNIYISHLCTALIQKKLYGPFLRPPPSGKLENIDFYAAPSCPNTSPNMMMMPYQMAGPVCTPQQMAGQVCSPQQMAGQLCLPQQMVGQVCSPQQLAGQVCSPQQMAGQVLSPQQLAGGPVHSPQQLAGQICTTQILQQCRPAIMQPANAGACVPSGQPSNAIACAPGGQPPNAVARLPSGVPANTFAVNAIQNITPEGMHSQGQISVGEAKLAFNLKSDGQGSCLCPPCQCSVSGQQCACKRSTAGAETSSIHDEEVICNYLMQKLNFTPDFLNDFDATLTSFMDLCKAASIESKVQSSNKSQMSVETVKSQFLPKSQSSAAVTNVSSNSQGQRPMSPPLPLDDMRDDINKLLAAIMAELSGDVDPGTNDYLEHELARYKTFVMNNSDMSKYLLTLKSDMKLRNCLLLSLQNDLVKLLNEQK